MILSRNIRVRSWMNRCRLTENHWSKHPLDRLKSSSESIGDYWTIQSSIRSLRILITIIIRSIGSIVEEFIESTRIIMFIVNIIEHSVHIGSTWRVKWKCFFFSSACFNVNCPSTLVLYVPVCRVSFLSLLFLYTNKNIEMIETKKPINWFSLTHRSFFIKRSSRKSPMDFRVSMKMMVICWGWRYEERDWYYLSVCFGCDETHF